MHVIVVKQQQQTTNRVRKKTDKASFSGIWTSQYNNNFLVFRSKFSFPKKRILTRGFTAQKKKSSCFCTQQKLNA